MKLSVLRALPLEEARVRADELVCWDVANADTTHLDVVEVVVVDVRLRIWWIFAFGNFKVRTPRIKDKCTKPQKAALVFCTFHLNGVPCAYLQLLCPFTTSCCCLLCAVPLLAVVEPLISSHRLAMPRSQCVSRWIHAPVWLMEYMLRYEMHALPGRASDCSQILILC